MTRPKPTVPAKRVWRISERAPMGEWVEIETVKATLRSLVRTP